MFAVDDDFPVSPKLESIDDWRTQALAVACWTLLGAACRKRGNGGIVSRRLLDDVLHRWPKKERTRAADALVGCRGESEHGLWEIHEKGWMFHDWEVWQPTAEEASIERRVRSTKTERQRRWRHGLRLRVDGEASTERLQEASTERLLGASTERLQEASTQVDAKPSLARIAGTHARARIPSRPVPSGSTPPPPASSSGAEEEANFEGDEDRPVFAAKAERWRLWSREYDKRYKTSNGSQGLAKSPKYAEHVNVLRDWSLEADLSDAQCIAVLDRFFADKDPERVGPKHWIGFLVPRADEYLKGSKAGNGEAVPLARQELR